MDSLFELEDKPACICVPFSDVPVEPGCPVHDPTWQIHLPAELMVRPRPDGM